MRALVLAAALGVMGGQVLAQSPSREDLDRLNQMLDEKLGSGQLGVRGLAKKQREKPLKPEDFYSIKRDQDPRPRRRPVPAQAPDKQSLREGQSGGIARLAGIDVAHASEPNKELAQSNSAPAEAAPLHVLRDRYVIQLRYDLTREEFDAARETLKNKYNLEITKHNSLGLIYVSPATPTTRSAPAAQVEPRELGKALEPRIITELRKEPFVEGAYVDFLIEPKSLPRGSDAKATGEGQATTYYWHWRTGAADDGNWGLKLIRMPPVWSILNRARKLNPDRARTRMAFLDVGFGTHGHITYNAVLGAIPANPAKADCTFSHGTHVVGIAGALYGKGRGTDGMVPDAKLDAIPVGSELFIEGANLGLKTLNQRLVLFTEAIWNLNDFFDQYPPSPDERRVVNVSLGYNWSALGFEFGRDPSQDDSIMTHILDTGRSVQRLASKLRDNVLFVAAAGNDSEGAQLPDKAEFATPFAFVALHNSSTFAKSDNILVVEAAQRDGARASFSNAGGHVSAPGVDIMSTLASVNDAYGMCTGTSQATPHVTALAAILFELDPKKSPAEIADIIRSSAIPDPAGGAPRIDALAAVIKLSKDNLRYLADLNGDGKVDSADLEIFKTHLIVLEEAKRNGKPITIDLNGDGNVDENEQCWPLIDFNGSGKASYLDTDARSVGGEPRTDLQLLEEAWTDTAVPFQTAMRESGLDQLIARWKASPATPLTAGAPPAPPGAQLVASQGSAAMTTSATAAAPVPCN